MSETNISGGDTTPFYEDIMPIPDLDSDYLPEGIYECTLDEIKSHFGNNQRRDELCKKLSQYLSDARNARINGYLIIDGSFVTSKEMPGDIDAILVICGNYSLLAPITRKEYELISPSNTKSEYEIHLIPTYEDEPDITNHWIDFFKKVRGNNTHIKKGLLRVAI